MRLCRLIFRSTVVDRRYREILRRRDFAGVDVDLSVASAADIRDLERPHFVAGEGGSFFRRIGSRRVVNDDADRTGAPFDQVAECQRGMGAKDGSRAF